MKILFLTRSFYPKVGGVEKHILKVSYQLIKKGHTISVVTEFGGTQKLDGINIYKIPDYRNGKLKKFKQWIWLYKNRNIIDMTDIIHCHDIFYLYMPFRFIFPFKKVYTTFHGYETIFPPKLSAIIIRRISKFLSFGTINVGEYIKKWYKTSADYTIYGGIDKRKVKLKNEVNGKNIIFIGRIEADNGVNTYAKVLEILSKNNYKYDFKVVGDGTLKSIFSNFGKVLGFKDNIENYIENADIVFASSYLSILESLQYKKIIYSVWDNELKKDYLASTPFSLFISIQSNPEVIAEDIIKNNFSKEKLDKGYNWVNTQTWENISNVYIKLWNK